MESITQSGKMQESKRVGKAEGQKGGRAERNKDWDNVNPAGQFYAVVL